MPAQWRAQTIDDRARMLAHVWLKATREAYAAENERLKSGSKPDKEDGAGGRKTGGMAEFQRMKQRMRPPAGWKAPEAGK